MAVGIYQNAGEVNQRAGLAAQAVRDAFTRVEDFKFWLDTQTDQMLEDLGIASGDIPTLRSSFTDLDQLRLVYLGLATRTPAYDYRTFAKQLA